MVYTHEVIGSSPIWNTNICRCGVIGNTPLFQSGIGESYSLTDSNMESYRSGHNGAVLKTVRRQRHKSSSLLLSAIKGLRLFLPIKSRPNADMLELVDGGDSKSSGEIHVGSTPTIGTKICGCSSIGRTSPFQGECLRVRVSSAAP